MAIAFQALTPEQLGIIPNLTPVLRVDKPVTATPPDKHNSRGLDILHDSAYSFTDETGCRRTVKIIDILHRVCGIIGRGTIVASVRCICDQPRGCPFHDQDLVMKFSFPAKGRADESSLVEHANTKARDDHSWARKHLPRILYSFSVPYDEECTPQGRFKEHLKEDYEERVVRVLIQEMLFPITNLAPRECAQVFYDILQIHRWLFKHAKILHRDISQANIMYREQDGNRYGVLNDYDLAVDLTRDTNEPTSKHRTGTIPYMSIDLLNPDWKFGHRYRHDLESLFYVMFTFACRYSGPGQRSNVTTPLSKWFSSARDVAYSLKQTFMVQNYSSDHVTTYFSDFKPWLDDLASYIQHGYALVAVKKRPQRSAAPQKNAPPFDWDTLDGQITFGAFHDVMRQFGDPAQDPAVSAVTLERRHPDGSLDDVDELGSRPGTSPSA